MEFKYVITSAYNKLYAEIKEHGSAEDAEKAMNDAMFLEETFRSWTSDFASLKLAKEQ